MTDSKRKEYEEFLDKIINLYSSDNEQQQDEASKLLKENFYKVEELQLHTKNEHVKLKEEFTEIQSRWQKELIKLTSKLSFYLIAISGGFILLQSLFGKLFQENIYIQIVIGAIITIGLIYYAYLMYSFFKLKSSLKILKNKHTDLDEKIRNVDKLIQNLKEKQNNSESNSK